MVKNRRAVKRTNAGHALRWTGAATTLMLGCQGLLGIEDSTLRPTAADVTDCVLNSDCVDQSQVCIFKTCSPPCQKDKDCDAGLFCLLAGDNGSACVSPQQAQCDGATAETCPAGSVCSDGQCRTDCSGATNACRPDQECSASGVCLAADTTGGGGEGGSSGAGPGGAGPGGAGPGVVCVPNESACDGNRATTCNAEGTGFVGVGLRCSSKQTCVAGACETQECTPSALFCAGNTVRRCAEDGLSSAEAEDCGVGRYCHAASATCKVGVCAADEAACDGQRATTCNASGSGFLGGGTLCRANETCEAGACLPHVCTPDETFCLGQDVKSCAANGLGSTVEVTCANQTCIEDAEGASCVGVCAPGQSHCAANGLEVQACKAANGQWDAGVACVNQACPVGKTACEGSCKPGTKKCSGNGVQTCDAMGEYPAAVACGAATPVCSGSGVCVSLSCGGLAATCGAAGNADCCASAVAPGGTYNRGNDANYPATVADFRLDTYEVTVGRFRKFVAAYSQSMIAAGAGKNPNNAADSGWDTAWNASLPADKAALQTLTKCSAAYQTWTDAAAANENRPINCVNWFVANAFCSWDGGRLPTEAEWNYAAAGGSEQRLYPWGGTSPGATASLAVFDCLYPTASGNCSGVTNIAPVGSATGNTKWGHADLAGNLWEWTVDGYGSFYSNPCNNCASLGSASNRVVRGGTYNYGQSYMRSTFRFNTSASLTHHEYGVRCARKP